MLRICFYFMNAHALACSVHVCFLLKFFKRLLVSPTTAVIVQLKIDMSLHRQ